MATVLGLIGAGGIGQALYDAQQLMFYRQMLTYILITWGLLAALDRLSRPLRQKHVLSQVAAA
jgi:phosphonate transport system permease protein